MGYDLVGPAAMLLIAIIGVAASWGSMKAVNKTTVETTQIQIEAMRQVTQTQIEAMRTLSQSEVTTIRKWIDVHEQESHDRDTRIRNQEVLIVKLTTLVDSLERHYSDAMALANRLAGLVESAPVRIRKSKMAV